MYVVAKHRIEDPETFFSLAQVAAEEAPAGVYGRQFCPSRDGAEAVCLWEAAALDPVRDYLDSLLGEASENTYFQVDAPRAIGIPEPIGAELSFETYRGTAPENYQRYFVPAIGAPLAVDLVDLAALRPGERVLDVACGTGIVTRLAAERVGAAGAVTGVDVNPGMLEVARSIEAATAIDWHEASAEELPLDDETFDVALCQLGLQFFSDKPAALREMRRVLVPGGRLLIGVPGPAPPLFAILDDALGRHVGPDAAAFVRAVFSVHDPAELGGLVRGAGFEAVETSSAAMTLRLPPPEEFLWQYVHSTPLAAAAARLNAEQRDALEREVVAEWHPFVADGGIVLEVGMTVATARR